MNTKRNETKPERDFKGVFVPASIWLHKGLKPIEKMLLMELDSLDNESGCFAKNAFFAIRFEITPSRISQLIKKLESYELIDIEYVYFEGTKQIQKRIIRMTDTFKKLKGGIEDPFNEVFNKLKTPFKKLKTPLINAEEEYINISNTSIVKQTLSRESAKKEIPEEIFEEFKEDLSREEIVEVDSDIKGSSAGVIQEEETIEDIIFEKIMSIGAAKRDQVQLNIIRHNKIPPLSEQKYEEHVRYWIENFLGRGERTDQEFRNLKNQLEQISRKFISESNWFKTKSKHEEVFKKKIKGFQTKAEKDAAAMDIFMNTDFLSSVQ